MKTKVLMRRELFKSEVLQDSKTGFFSATDLVRAGNFWRMSNRKSPFNMSLYFKKKETKEFVEELKFREGAEVVTKGRGRNSKTWVHPLIFIDIALDISPKLKIEVYQWLYDELIKNRNTSGDSYKKMTGYLWANHGDKKTFPKEIKKVAHKIQLACGVSGVDKWEYATEDQLKLRDKIQENISLLADVLKSNDKAVELAIIKATEKGI